MLRHLPVGRRAVASAPSCLLSAWWSWGPKRAFYHDGRFATLRDVVAHYDGFFGLGLTSAEIGTLIKFLKSL